MRKEEALALGVPADRVSEFQDLYHRDLDKAAKREAAKGRDEDEAQEAIKSRESTLRTAIVKVSYLLNVDDLSILLEQASTLFATHRKAVEQPTEAKQEESK